MRTSILLSLSAAALLFTACGPGAEQTTAEETANPPTTEASASEGDVQQLTVCPGTTTNCGSYVYRYSETCGDTYRRLCTQMTRDEFCTVIGQRSYYEWLHCQ